MVGHGAGSAVLALVFDAGRTAGILVDGAHAGYRTKMEAMACASKPFMVSHSNCDAVTSAHSDAREDQIKACAATHDVMGMTGLSHYIGDKEARPQALFRHIDHVAQLVGFAHVASLDFLEKPDVFWRMASAAPGTFLGPGGSAMEPCRSMRHEDQGL